MNDARRAAIGEIYAQIAAPDWAAPNLDGLVDVLRDLSWLPTGELVIRVPDLAELDDLDASTLRDVLHRSATESADGQHPLVLE